MRGRLFVAVGSLLLASSGCKSLTRDLPTTRTPTRSQSRSCGQITVRRFGNDFGYRVRIVSGSVTCKTARMQLTRFIARARFPAGWFCTRGHSADTWAASCARTSGALVRAYLIAG